MASVRSQPPGPPAVGCREKSKSVMKKKEHTYFGVVGYTNKELGKLVAFRVDI